MTTLEMEIALMKHLNIRKNLIVPNVHWAFPGLHECDLLCLSSNGYATEVEIKISRSDLLKDKEKLHGHVNLRIKNLYFAVPEHLKDLALEEIPSRAGLYVVKTTGESYWKYNVVEMIKKATPVKNAKKWSDDDRYRLARLGAIRILGLKESIYSQIKNAV